MKASIPRGLTLTVLLALGIQAYAADFQCRDTSGCKAAITRDGVQEQVVFRRGDIISTDDGWTVNPNEGWVKLRRRGDQDSGTHGGY